MKISTKPRPKTVYIPAAFGNRSLPPSEQMRVIIEPMGVAEFESVRASALDVRGTDHLAMARKLRVEVIKRRVVSVENVEADGSAITDGAGLVAALEGSSDAAHALLLDEVYQAIVDASVLEEGRAKN